MSALGSPIWPAKQETYSYQGKELEVFFVTMPDGTTQKLAMLKPSRSSSIFIDPQNPSAGEITWQGSWRSLERPWKWSARWQTLWMCGA
ncbi:hypothetical protein EG834_19925 [bacterium]|nr:hypothetical protein [bacterium]